MWMLAGLGALALATRWSPAARWMTGAIGFLGGIVAMIALLAILVRLLLVAGLAVFFALAATTALWPQAGAVQAILVGALVFAVTLATGFGYAFGRWI
jgi:hypothetical protein